MKHGRLLYGQHHATGQIGRWVWPLDGAGERFCSDIARQAATLMPALRDMPPNIVASALGEDAGALGAASHAMEAWQASF